MSVTTSGTSPLGALLESQAPASRPAPQEAQSIEFKQVMKSALPENVPLPPPLPRTSPPGAGSAPPLPSEPPPSPVPEPKSEPAVFQPGILEVPSEPAQGERALAAVRQAMTAAGIPMDGLSFSYWEAWQWFPGGGYMNHYLTVTAPDGRSADFSAKLAERMPHVAADEIRQHLLA